MRTIFRSATAAALAVCAALVCGAAGANTLSANIADYNAAKVALANGTVTVPAAPALATYNVTTTALTVGSSFTVTLPAHFTFASAPSLNNTGTATFTLASGGSGSQSATFTVGTANLTVGQSLSLGSFSVGGAAALETPIPVANALQLSMQAIGVDATPLTVAAFASEPGAAMITVGAIQFLDATFPSLGAKFGTNPVTDSPTGVINAFEISAQVKDFATQSVPVLNPNGTANSLAATDTATVTVPGLWGGIGSAFISTTSACNNPILNGTVTPTRLTFTSVPIGPEEFGCVTATGQMQPNPNGFLTSFAPGPVTDFLAGPVNNEFAGLTEFFGPALPANITVAFSPNAVPPDGASQSTMTVTLSNPYSGSPGINLSGVAFSDTLPPGVKSLGIASDTCGGTGTSTATGFSKAGISLAGGASCTIQVQVVAPFGTAVGPQVNTTSTVASNEASPGSPGSATLTVTNDPIFTLTIAAAGSGSGTVTSSPSGINCSATNNQCAMGFASGTPVVLTAAPAPYSSFTGWSGGGCSGTGTCTVTVSQAQAVTANFAPVAFTLSVTEAGNGAGLVSSSPVGIVCSAAVNQCGASFGGGSTVTLTASAASGSSFAGWSGGGCTGTGPCVVTMSAAQGVTANFAKIPGFNLSIALPGGGAGVVSSTPSGIACGATCSASFTTGTVVTLSATPSAGSSFAGWSGGGCSGTGTCTATVSADTAITANFTGTSTNLLAAVLPGSRSVTIGTTATAFAYMINTGGGTGAPCGISPATSVPATFLYQTTDQATNAVTGSPNTPVPIAPGGTQSFLIALTPNSAFAATPIDFTFACGGSNPAPVVAGLNDFTLSASATPVPDIIALAASADPGYVDLSSATRMGSFAVATENLGAGATIIAGVDTGAANLPLTLTICQTNPQNSACAAAPAPTTTLQVNPGDTDTFGIFVGGTAAIADMPAVNRVFVRFTDSGGALRGETSVAVRTR